MNYMAAKVGIPSNDKIAIGRSIFAYNRNDPDAMVDVAFRMDTKVPFTSVNAMVTGVLGTLGKGETIGALHIVDHGVGAGDPDKTFTFRLHGPIDKTKHVRRPGKMITTTTGSGTGTVHMGKDDVSVHTLPKFAHLLGQLRSHFSADGWGYLHNCYVGRDRDLVMGFARLWGVPVTASTEMVRSVVSLTFGATTTAYPDGRVEVSRFPLHHI